MDQTSRHQRHQEKWLHNRAFLPSIDETNSDWIVTVAFYAALHCFEVLSALDKNSPHHSHTERLKRLKTTNRYLGIHKHFHPLWVASAAVRYDANSSSWIPAETAKETFVGHHLHQIERSVLKLTKIEIDLKPVEWTQIKK